MIKQVSNNIFLGDSHSSLHEIDNIKTLGINAIINVAKDLNDPWYEGIESYKFGLLDGPGNDYIQFKLAVETGYFLWAAGKQILIHCHEGKSRSVAVSLGILLYKTKPLSVSSLSELLSVYPFKNHHRLNEHFLDMLSRLSTDLRLGK